MKSNTNPSLSIEEKKIKKSSFVSLEDEDISYAKPQDLVLESELLSYSEVSSKDTNDSMSKKKKMTNNLYLVLLMSQLKTL